MPSSCPDCVKLREQIAVLQDSLHDFELMLRSPVAEECKALKSAFGLTGNETALIMALYRARGRCVVNSLLIDARMRSLNADGSLDLVRAYVLRVRKKLGQDVIVNNWGNGYSISPAGYEKIKSALTANGLEPQ